MKALAILLLSLTSLTSSNPGINGIKIVTRQMMGGLTDIRTEYVAGDRFRNEWQTQMGDRPGTAMASIVLRGERDKVFVLDLQTHEYLTFETDSRGMVPGSRVRPAAQSGGTLQIDIDYVDTGERKEFFGHTARHIITKEKRVASPGACSRDSSSEIDGWYIDASVMPAWRQAKKNAFGVVVASVVSFGTDGRCADKMDKIEVHRNGIEPGFPVKLITTLKSEAPRRDGSPRALESNWGSEVVELKEGALDPALFEIPGDYRKVDSLRNWASAAVPQRQLTGWEWFKQKVQEMFR
jgi:hypothetical protein